MGEDELVQEKPFLEKAVVCAAFVLRQVVLVFSPFGTTSGGHCSLKLPGGNPAQYCLPSSCPRNWDCTHTGTILIVDEMSWEMGVRDLASRFFSRNVHRKGATSAPNLERDEVPSLGRSTVTAFAVLSPLTVRLLIFFHGTHVFTGLAHGPNTVSGHPCRIEQCLRCQCEAGNQRVIREDNQQRQETRTRRRKILRPGRAPRRRQTWRETTRRCWQCLRVQHFRHCPYVCWVFSMPRS